MLEAANLRSALEKLQPYQRRALLLVAVDGLSYDDAGALCGTAAGTMKSRVNRARDKLRADMGYNGRGDIGAGPVLKAALQAR
jgi:RNA polymerase sigma-70 factor (ECF subfamily)